MGTRAEIISELRTMFKHGATPSRLIRHIVAQHASETGLHGLIQEYFREAFGVGMVRGLNPVDDYQHADLRYAFLNEQLVHEMLEKMAEWEEDAGSHPGEQASWIDSLSATSDEMRIMQVQAAPPPELAQSWAKLGPKEQYFIQMSMASANGLYETVKILARLAESLEHKIDELESQAVERDDRK